MSNNAKSYFSTLRNNLLADSERWSPIRTDFLEAAVITVDDAIKNPDELAAFAKTLDFDVFDGHREFRVYPGERAVISWPMDHLYERIRHCYSEAVTGVTGEFRRQPCFFTNINSRKLESIHPKQQAPHIDYAQPIVAILHLTKRAPAGATGFYRHRTTGIQRLPATPTIELAEQMQREGFSPLSGPDYKAFIKRISYDGVENYATPELGTGVPSSNMSWELLGKIDGLFNRLVIFPGECFHSPLYNPVRETDADRLTLNFAFERI